MLVQRRELVRELKELHDVHEVQPPDLLQKLHRILAYRLESLLYCLCAWRAELVCQKPELVVVEIPHHLLFRDEHRKHVVRRLTRGKNFGKLVHPSLDGVHVQFSLGGAKLLHRSANCLQEAERVFYQTKVGKRSVRHREEAVLNGIEGLLGLNVQKLAHRRGNNLTSPRQPNKYTVDFRLKANVNSLARTPGALSFSYFEYRFQLAAEPDSVRFRVHRAGRGSPVQDALSERFHLLSGPEDGEVIDDLRLQVLVFRNLYLREAQVRVLPAAQRENERVVHEVQLVQKTRVESDLAQEPAAHGRGQPDAILDVVVLQTAPRTARARPSDR